MTKLYVCTTEARIVCDAIGSKNGAMTIACALREAYDAGKAGRRMRFYPEDKMQVIKPVYLAWVNDMLLGVFKEKEEGVAKIQAYLDTNFPDEWKHVDGRWKNSANSSQLSRLQVEAWPVIGATRSVR